MHLRAARTNGLTNDEIKELILQSAIYCGVPDANTAFRIAQGVLESTAESSLTRPEEKHDRVRVRRRPHPVRQVQRGARRRTAPTTWPPSSSSGDPGPHSRPRPGCGRRGDPRQRQRRRRGEPQRRADGRPARRLPRLGAGLDGQPAVRLLAGRRDGRLADDRDRRRRRRAHRRRGVDDARPLGAAQAEPRLPGRQPRGRLDHPGLATGQPETMPAEWTVSLGEANEQLQEKYDVSRERQDAFAARSHTLADQAWNDGFYDDLVVGVPDTEVARDESIRPGSSAESLAKLKPSFRKDGTITAGNASPLSDGASAVLLGSEKAPTSSAHPRRPDRRPRRARARAAAVRLRPRRGRREGDGPGRHRLVRRRRRRAQRGLRRAVAGLPRRLEASTPRS